MKTLSFIYALLVSVVMVSCLPINSANTPSSNSSLETPSSTPATTTDFIEPDSETFVSLMPTIKEYLYFRKKSVISGDTKDLWENFPELREGTDIEKGINSEEFIVANYQSLKPFDGNIFPEYYERFKVKVSNDGTEVLVHGMELYLWLDENNKFKDSGGEFKIVLYLHKKDSRWVVYKTDEVTISEWHQFSP
ncbi:MAG: hypothetical protein K8R77_16745 [Anaerolineaceae bacterium]|nr:hypothetical protein [Anaerolineaceae bacterium]